MANAARKEFLRKYLHEVVCDLLANGVIYKQSNRSLDDFIKNEPAAIVGSVWRDFKEAGLDVGGNIARHATEIVSDGVKNLLGNIFSRRP